MFIQQVVEKIWEPISKEYKKTKRRLESLPKKAILEILDLPGDNLFHRHESSDININHLTSNGCSFKRNCGRFGGCSMCDYQSEFLVAQCTREVLLKRFPNLYVDNMRSNLLQAREKNPEAARKELLACYNAFCQDEMPRDVFCKFFSQLPIEGQPDSYCIEVRAEDVTEERLKLTKDCFGKIKVEIEFGVETSNPWLRNFWLNKSLSDKQITNALTLIKNVRFYAHTNLLIGIPGLTEQQSIDSFVESILWIDQKGADIIPCLPLNRKVYTLQGYLHRRLCDNHLLRDKGLVQGEHTGVPWLFTVVEALALALKEDPKLEKKIITPQIYADENSISNTVAYNATPECNCNDLIRKRLSRYFERGRGYANHIWRLSSELPNLACDCYERYQALLEKQRGAGTIPETLRLVGTEIARNVWPNYWQRHVQGLEKELDAYS